MQRTTIPDRLQQIPRQLVECDLLIPRMHIVRAASRHLDMMRYPNRTASLISPIHPPPAS
jgi:hypothetical protein